ncbi:MAG: tRNA glutamyl-Q(34) synthetase GluQRS [Acidiferrobacterales bacterium]|nr:tRNA glutamyl-Q(34) synthetase GluQRS [Acidiferrobacterales bacterium]
MPKLTKSVAGNIRGRYAPSPTGPLHLGNLRTALLAWLHARLQGGEFYIRIDDLDTPRVIEDSANQILRDLEWLGLDWDGGVWFQSNRIPKYQQAFDSLRQQELIYECFCSRKEIQQLASAPHGREGVYPGLCANLNDGDRETKRQKKLPASRIRVADQAIAFEDGCLGRQVELLVNDCGDFVVKRADGLFAYQLAIVVDDIEQQISDVVRGADLLDSTARQLYLINQLQPEFTPPSYWHVPLMMSKDGQRMAKRDGAKSIDEWRDGGSNQKELVAHLAHSVGLIDREIAISARELIDEISIETWQNALVNKEI